MQARFSIGPNRIRQEQRIFSTDENFKKYALAYIGKYTYCWNLLIENGVEFQVGSGVLKYNMQIGNFNSIAENLTLMSGKNHNIRCINTGALALMLGEKDPMRSIRGVQSKGKHCYSE